MSAAGLTEWLRAQVAEDERRARAAFDDRVEIDRLSRQPIRTVKDDGVWKAAVCEVEGFGIKIYDEGGHTPDQAVHVATWDPARVLAECEAKRRIIALYRQAWTNREPMFEVVRLLALPYADRPGYHEEWRP